MNNAVSRIYKDLNNVSQWLRANKLKLNVNKAKCIFISSEMNINAVIHIDYVLIERVDEYKYLGVIIDENFKFNINSDFISKKFANKLPKKVQS